MLRNARDNTSRPDVSRVEVSVSMKPIVRKVIGDYSQLQTGDSVVVTGSVAIEGDRVIATSIRRLGGA